MDQKRKNAEGPITHTKMSQTKPNQGNLQNPRVPQTIRMSQSVHGRQDGFQHGNSSMQGKINEAGVVVCPQGKCQRAKMKNEKDQQRRKKKDLVSGDAAPKI